MPKSRIPWTKLWLLSLASALPLGGLSPTAQAQSTLTNGLVAYWNFDGNLLDSVAGFHGTGRGTTPPGFSPSRDGFGQALTLDGSDQFVEITGGSEDDLEFPGGSMSIAGWFRVETFDTEWQALIAKGEGNNYRVARRSTGNSIAYAGGVGEGADDAPEVNDGEWHHFVAVSDAEAVEFGTAIYIDGALYGINPTPPVLAENSARLMIGENPEARNREWEGDLDDIAIWNRVLTADEVTELFTGPPISTLLPPRSAPIVISEISQNLNAFTFRANGIEGATLDPAAAVLTLNGQPAPVTNQDEGDGVFLFTHTPSTPFSPGSTNEYTIELRTTTGEVLTQTGTIVLPTPWFPPEDLPGPTPVEGAWAIRWIFNAGTIGDLQTAFSNIVAAASDSFEGVSVDTTNQVINFPETGGFFGNGSPFPDEVVNHESFAWVGEDYIVFAVGHIVIPEAGEYTFGVHSDDGFAFRIRGAEAISVSGNGSLDPVDPEAVVHPNTTGDSNTRAVFRFDQPGVYRVEWFYYERGGGDNGEFYAARGAFTADAETTSWKLIGDPTPSQEFVALGTDTNGWTVISSDPGGDQLNDWFTAMAELDATTDGGTNYPALNIGDPDTNPGVLAFPKNAPGDDDDYALRATATLVVPEAGTYDVGFNSDDGAYVKITGQTFDEIIVNATMLSIIDPTDTVICDCLTGDSATVARLTLPAGNHEIEAGMFERGGGSFLRVWVAEEGAVQPPVLGVNSAGTYQTAQALQLTDDPPSTGGGGDGERISIARDAEGNVTITFEGTLESAPDVTGPWTAVAGATSPHTVTPSETRTFFRSRQ